MTEQTKEYPITKEELVSILQDISSGFQEFEGKQTQTLLALLKPMLEAENVKKTFFKIFRGQTDIYLENLDSVSEHNILRLLTYISKNPMSLKTQAVTSEELSHIYNIVEALRMFFIAMQSKHHTA